jgi:hypothetical protein
MPRCAVSSNCGSRRRRPRSPISDAGPGRMQEAVVEWVDDRLPFVEAVDAELYRRVPNSAHHCAPKRLALAAYFLPFLVDAASPC